MAYRTVTFPVQLSRPVDPIILGARIAVADMLRAQARRAIDGATNAGIDAFSQGQRLVFLWESAKQTSRFLKGYPASLARWCFRTELESAARGGDQGPGAYPAAGTGGVASYGPRWLTMLPGGAVMVSAGGVRGVSTEPLESPITLHEVYEVRLYEVPGAGYSAEVVMTNSPASRDDVPDPVDGDMEREDA